MPVKRPIGRPPKARHLDTLLANLKEVERLLEIHTKIAGSTVGAKHKVEVLNKSGIVLLVACWEAFIEDLAEVSFRLQLRRAKRPEIFPSKVLALASKKLREDKDERRVWDLAGDGWKTVLRDHQDQVLKRYIGNFNTPKPKQIDELFSSLIAVPKVSKKWSWHRCTPAKARARLDKLVTLRGAIAHRVSAPRSVRKSDVEYAASFIGRLAVATHNAVNTSLSTRLGHPPWQEYIYGDAG
jgi:hypothetical protein